MGMAGTIFDQDAMTTLAQVPDDVVVLQQDPLAGNQVCWTSEITQYRIDLVVDLAAPMVTTSLPFQTTPTLLPEDSEATTTIPKKSVTTTIPKATTTTTP
jgi:hypothetical protein